MNRGEAMGRCPKARRTEIVLVLACSLGAFGCVSSRLVTIEVRDRITKLPVADAVVAARVPYVLHLVPPHNDTDRLDQHGRTTLLLGTGSMLSIRVYAPKRPTHDFSIPHPARAGPSGWIGPTYVYGSEAASMEVIARLAEN